MIIHYGWIRPIDVEVTERQTSSMTIPTLTTSRLTLRPFTEA